MVGFGFEELGEGAQGATGAVVEADSEARVAREGVLPDHLAFEEERIPELGSFYRE